MIAHPPTGKNKRKYIRSMKQLRNSLSTELFSDQAFVKILLDFSRQLESSFLREFSFWDCSYKSILSFLLGFVQIQKSR